MMFSELVPALTWKEKKHHRSKTKTKTRTKTRTGKKHKD